jgi:eukaryotic-like serine/threonine-protein kinase
MTTRIGKYEVGTQLGNGAFGVVYNGRDTELGREVALKVLRESHAADDSVVARFLQEARAAAAIRHPGIAAVYDAGVVGGRAYLAMELLRGTSLTQHLRARGRLDASEAIDIARQLASVLQAVHEAGIVHRDLKPDNVFVLPGNRVKLLDFGIAKLGASVHTQTEIVLGTPRYMSPEQGRSSAKVDARSDIYALGCMLYELVCGSAPFAHSDPFEVIAQHQYVRPRSPRAVVPSVPEALERLILWMLEKSPDARPASMSVVESALDPRALVRSFLRRCPRRRR